jgi:putative transcriptional regulator
MASLAPVLLLSMPQLVDPNFKQTVVLLCKHSEDGAFGLVVNRPLVTSGRFVVELQTHSTDETESNETRELVSADHDLQVWVGGPVEPYRSWMLVGEEPSEVDRALGVRIASGLYLSTSPDLLRRMLEPSPPPRTRLVVGYAGWGPGQLDAELHDSAWLLSEVDRDLIFETPAEQMWEAAIRRLGADPSTLQRSRGVH